MKRRHKHYKWGSAGSYSDDLDGEPHNISRYTLNLNVLPMVGLGAELRFSKQSIDYNLTFLCFNVNGYLIFVDRFDSNEDQ